MKIELHLIQNFAPSCLNRDDTNSPKDCLFGGVRRARVSSQCLKRATRTSFREDGLLPKENLACRTKRLVEEVAKKLSEKGRDAAIAGHVVTAALGGIGLAVTEDGQTQYLLFLSQAGIHSLVDVCLKHWDALAKVASASAGKEESQNAKEGKEAKKAKKEAKQSIPDEIKVEIQKVLDGQSAADLALFGRMLADLPGNNIDAACQVAHAFSTNKVSMEMDFFTAVDDLKGEADDAGAGMMGIVGYNSACFYRYAVLDVDQLVTNLGGDADLAFRTIEAFLRASALAVPSGKQNTFAAHSRPDFIYVRTLKSGAPLSLANSFARPAVPDQDKDLTQASIDQLADYWKKVEAVYGNGKNSGDNFFCGVTKPSTPPAGWHDAGTLDALIAKTLDAAKKGASA